MRALSIQQPWAWLIVNGHKDIENRAWWTNVRGVIAVHAGIKYDHDGHQWVRSHFPDLKLPPKSHHVTGGIVGTVEITDCVATSYSKWFFGPWGFVLKNAQPCERQQLRGQLGFFKVPDGIVNQLIQRVPADG